MDGNSESNGHKSGEVRRALVSLKKLNEVAGKLPSPAEFEDRSTTVKVGSVNMKFEKIRFIGSDGKAEFRWSYSSRIVI